MPVRGSIDKRGEGKNVLPHPFSRRVLVLPLQGISQVNTAKTIFQILFVLCLDLLQMAFERFRKIHRQHRDPILASFAVTNRDAEITKIDIFDSQPHALHQAQSASIKQSGHESVRTMEMRE